MTSPDVDSPREPAAPEEVVEPAAIEEERERFARLKTIGRNIAGLGLCLGFASGAFLLTPDQEFEAGPIVGEVSFDKTPSVSGGTELDLSLAGGMEMPTHRGIGVDVQGRDLAGSENPESIPDEFISSNDTSEEFTSEVQDAIKVMSRNGVLFYLGGTAVAGLLLAGTLERDRFKRAASTAALTGALGISVLGGVPLATYNGNALNETTYRGLAAEAETYIGETSEILEAYPGNIQDFGDILNYVGVLRQEAINSEFIPDDAIGVLAYADIHCMPGSYDLKRSLIKTFPNIVVTAGTGDYGDLGSPLEGELCWNGAEQIQVPQVGTRANHDRRSTEDRLEELGVNMLDYETASAGGFNFYGVADSTDTWRPGVERVPNDERPEDVERIRRDLLFGDTNIALIAHPYIARQVAGTVDVIITGDTHRQNTEIKDGSLVVNGGSLGAGGARSFSESGQGGERTASIIWYSPGNEAGAPPTPIAVSEINMGSPGQLEFSIDHCMVDLKQEQIAC